MVPILQTLLLGATLIDGTGAPPRLADLLIEGDRIVAVGEHLEAPGATVVDLSGRFIAPGLIDSHVHLDVNPGSVWRQDDEALSQELFAHHLRAFLAAGVTSVLDCGSKPELPQRIEGLPGPRLFWLGEILGPAGAYPEVVIDWARGSSGPTDIAAHLDRVAAAETDGLKLTLEAGMGPPTRWPLFSEAEQAQIALGAVARELPLYVHAMEPEEVEAALALRPHALVHGPARSSRRLARDVAEAGPFVVSTLTIYETIAHPTLPRERDLARLAHPVEVQTLEEPGYARRFRQAIGAMVLPRGMGFLTAPRLPAELMASSRERKSQGAIGRLHEAGVPVVMGTDAPTWPLLGAQLPGSADFRELELLEEAGLSPMEVLQAATSVPAAMLGHDDLGVLTEGSLADLVVLAEDPTLDASAWRSVEWVMAAGDLRTPAAWLHARPPPIP